MIEAKVQIPWLLTFLVTSVLFTIGLASPDWIDVKGVFRCGLWIECMGEKPCKTLLGSNVPAYIQVSQIITSLAICCLIMALCGYIAWIIPNKPDMYNSTRMISAGFTIAAGLLGTTGTVAYGICHLHNNLLVAISKVYLPNGWGYWLSVHSALSLLVMGCISACYAAGHRVITDDEAVQYSEVIMDNMSCRTGTDSDAPHSIWHGANGKSNQVYS